MSKTQTDPVIDALAPALAYLAVMDSYPPGTSPEANDKFGEYTASVERAARTLPDTLDGVAALIVSVLDIMPWDNLVMDDGQTFNVEPANLAECGKTLHRALQNAAVILAAHGAIPPLALADHALEPTEATVIRGMAERRARKAQPDTIEVDDVPAVPDTPEIEWMYARWVKAKGDMLLAHATDATTDAEHEAKDAAGSEAGDRMDREAWAMVGTRARKLYHVRHKIEVMRDSLSVGSGSMRLDGLELALLNSVDTDLAAVD